MKFFAAGVSHKSAPVELCDQLTVKQSAIVDLIEKLSAEDERLSVEERKDRWMPDPYATSSNLLPTAA